MPSAFMKKTIRHNYISFLSANDPQLYLIFANLVRKIICSTAQLNSEHHFGYNSLYVSLKNILMPSRNADTSRNADV